jgi:hypothetical protein
MDSIDLALHAREHHTRIAVTVVSEYAPQLSERLDKLDRPPVFSETLSVERDYPGHAAHDRLNTEVGPVSNVTTCGDYGRIVCVRLICGVVGVRRLK